MRLYGVDSGRLLRQVNVFMTDELQFYGLAIIEYIDGQEAATVLFEAFR